MTPESKEELREQLRVGLQKYLPKNAESVSSVLTETAMQLFTSYHQQQLEQAVREARIDENEYWREVAKSLQRGMLPTDFKARKLELKQLQSTKEDISND